MLSSSSGGRLCLCLRLSLCLRRRIVHHCIDILAFAQRSQLLHVQIRCFQTTKCKSNLICFFLKKESFSTSKEQQKATVLDHRDWCQLIHQEVDPFEFDLHILQSPFDEPLFILLNNLSINQSIKQQQQLSKYYLQNKKCSRSLQSKCSQMNQL